MHNNIINYKGKKFNSYEADTANFILGIKCVCTQYQVKIYNKGTQNKLPYPLLRVEKRFTKMQPLKKYGIVYLSDLQKFDKVAPLVKELTAMWNDVLIYDVKSNPNKTNLTAKEIDFLKDCRVVNYWSDLLKQNRFKYYRNKDLFNDLVQKFGTNWQLLVNDLIVNEWQQLLKTATNLPSGEVAANDVENKKCNKFTYKINGKNVAKRFCVSCGNDISNQKSNSSFCSAKYVGEPAAKKCRNNNSNPRNNFKGKIIKLESRGLLFDVKPYCKNF